MTTRRGRSEELAELDVAPPRDANAALAALPLPPGPVLSVESPVSDPGLAAVPDPLVPVVGAVVVVGEVVVVVGRSTLSMDSAVPDAQFTGLPPTACHVLPVT
jgi:hypothetical protein